jgi:hypothetical protein
MQNRQQDWEKLLIQHLLMEQNVICAEGHHNVMISESKREPSKKTGDWKTFGSTSDMRRLKYLKAAFSLRGGYKK